MQKKFAARLKEAKLATKNDIDKSVKKTDFDEKIKKINKNVIWNKRKHVEAEKITK